MATMRVAQIPAAKREFEIVERPIPEPPPGTVRVKVTACGVCHSDALVKEGLWPGIQYPRVPGHEVTGTIDAVGAGVIGWTRGQRVGVGWNGGYCGRCDPCRRGNLFACETHQVTGISFDGGYGEYMIAPVSAVARFPDELSPVDAAPLLCAGITTFNALRNSAARPGDVVGGLAPNGTLLVIGAPESLQLSPVVLIGGQLSVKGWYSGMSIDSEDTLAFSARTGVQSMNETFPFDRVNEAYERMMSGKARFRVVLTMK